MTSISIAYGDGIGPEIMTSVLKIIKESGANVKIEAIEIGENVYKKGFQSGITDTAIDSIARTKILLKAPITTPQGHGHRSLNVALRKKMNLYANIRPCVSYLDNKKIDIVIIRENEEDLYSGIEYRHTYDQYYSHKIITYSASERICKYAFEYARVNKRRKVTCFIKDNIMKMTDGSFHRAFNDIAKQYPEIENNSMIIDIGAAKLAKYPEEFDVVVTENLYGDIISDIAAELTGSVGLAGSMNIGTDYAMFEAVHGSAPDISGKNIANPSALLNAAVSMLHYINQSDVADKIFKSWIYTIQNEKIHTPDIFIEGKSRYKASTDEFTDTIIRNMRNVEINSIDAYHIQPNVLDIKWFKDQSDRLTTEKKECNNTRKLVGIDIAIDTTDIDNLLEVIKLFNVTTDFVLCSISVKGISIYPEKQLVKPNWNDHPNCRFLVPKNSTITNGDIYSLLKEFDKNNIEFTKFEKLYTYGDEYGFSI